MPKDVSSLSDYIREVFALVALSPDDKVSQEALKKFFSPHAEETDVATGTVYSRKEYLKVVKTLREELTDRKLVSQTVVIATPADPSNRMGALATTHVVNAVQNGKPVTATCVLSMRIQWVPEEGHEEGGHREIISDASILNVSS
ncbi:hypothetical protein DFH06DRAFT_1342782 [Mycena polygramma]|nr:hypothetical protein DFH06DRAFT_1342782 [Mycena polygramma]